MGCHGSSAKETVPINKSLIHLLVSGQTSSIIQRIEQQGSSFDINSKINFRGDTLLHYAYSKKNQQLIKYLQKNKADKNIRNNEGTTPIQMASDYLIMPMISRARSQKPVGNADIAVKNLNKTSDSTFHHPEKGLNSEAKENQMIIEKSNVALQISGHKENNQENNMLKTSNLKRTAAQADNLLQNNSHSRVRRGKMIQNFDDD